MSSLSELIVKKKQEILSLKEELLLRETELEELLTERASEGGDVAPVTDLSNDEIRRYSRQMILPELRVAGQRRLKASSVLIVGCGGLGCPAALYLAGAGVGRLELVDHDEVELSNLHRQVGHTQGRLGVNKAVSLAHSVKELNTEVEVVTHQTVLDSSNALSLLSKVDVVVDCSDNVATRYLLSDASVLLDKPLVSGSALRWEGQLTVYNYRGGPTYRCLYPSPPPPDTVTNCSDGGVLGPVVGVIGSLQALEAVKILAGPGPSYSGVMLVYDGLEGRARNMRLRGRREASEVTALMDYPQFCGAAATDKEVGLSLLPPTQRVTVQRLAELRRSKPVLLVDVRTETETEICSLEGSLNIPLADLQYEARWQAVRERLAASTQSEADIFVLCRRGNDSQLAVGLLKQIFPQSSVRDVIGGLHAWAKHIDPSFPVY